MSGVRRLLDERDYKHYHRGSDGQWVYRCEGLDCIGLPVLVLALIIIFGVATVTVAISMTVAAIRRRRAFKAGVLPATMVIRGHGQYSKTSGEETIGKYQIKLRKIPASDPRNPGRLERLGSPANPEDAADAEDPETLGGNPGSLGEGDVMREECCPVCLKAAADLKTVLELGCKHQLCEDCFEKIVRKDRLHARCPLCRVYLMVEKEGAQDCCRGPPPGELELLRAQAAGQRTQGENTMVV